MGGEDVDLLERVPVDQSRDALASGQLALGVLPLERVGIMARLVLPLPELVERIDLARRLGLAHDLCMNIQRWPSTSSARYFIPFRSSSSSDKILAPPARAVS